MDEIDIESLYSHFIKKIDNYIAEYNGPLTMRLSSSTNYFVLELYFDNNKRLTLMDQAQILNYANKDENHKVIYLSASNEEIQNAIYKLMGECIGNDKNYYKLIKFDNKEQLIECFNEFSSNAKYVTYYREFCNTIVEVRKIDFNCSQVQKNLNSTRTTNNIVPIATQTSFAPQFGQEIFNKSISTTISPLIDTTNTNFSVLPSNTTDYNNNIPKLTTSADSDNNYLAFILIPIAAFLVFFICCRSRSHSHFQRRNEEIDERQSISAASEENKEQSAPVIEESERLSTSTEGEQPSELQEVIVESSQRPSWRTLFVMTRVLNCFASC